MFRYKRGVKVSYLRQGYIYFLSRRYRELPEEQKKMIERLCVEAGGDHAQALFEYVTTGAGAAKICGERFLSEATLHRIVRRYYERFSREL